jgi:hypothetical protein
VLVRGRLFVLGTLCALVACTAAASFCGCQKKAGAAAGAGSNQPTQADQQRMKGNMPPGGPGDKAPGK